MFRYSTSILAAIITLLVLPGLSAVSTAATPASWPSANTSHQWVQYRDGNGNLIQDADDMSPDYLDIVYSAADPASVSVAFDGSTTFYRMQLQASPFISNGSWANGTWLVQFGTTANNVTGALYVNVNGQNGVVAVTDGANTDILYSFNARNASPDGVRVSAVQNATTWYLDFQAPLSALSSGTNVHLGLTASTILAFFYGTSTASGNPSQISKDFMYGTAVNFSNLASSSFLNIGTGILPVELTAFTAHAKEQRVQLRWTTATELNNFGFAVERSTDGERWQEIGFVAGAGNSSIERFYSFADRLPDTHASVIRYRLRQIDRDGTIEYSPVVQVTARSVAAVAITDAYPNPFNPTTTVSFILPQQTAVSMTLADITGRTVKTLIGETMMNAGSHAAVIDASGLPSGRYFVLLRTTNTQSIHPVVLMK